ncbi:MAG: ABC transporter permease [Acidobacteriota bacterium]|jgi:putative ABC transport system permease protein|nr:MAG: multidrug ABC transporter substrate-binding protein [Acidobacteriota bacterium]
MSILMTIRIALKALARNKLRTGLTMLGMIIGVAAVIAMVALGTGARAMIEDQIRAAGTNLITIYAGSFNAPGGVRGGIGTSVRLRPEDVDAIRDLPAVQYIAESVDTRAQMIYGNQNWNTRIEGTNVDLPAIRSWPVKYGSFFSEEDVRAATKVVVLGSNVADTLFGENVDPTDMQVRLRNHVFRVVGVMTSKGSSGGGMNMDDQVFIPYTTLMKKLTGQQYLSRIYVSAISADHMQPAIQQITEALRAAHNLAPGEEDDFIIQTLDDIVAVRTQATTTMTNLLAGIAGVSLVVGGIGIMNIMLVSVTERTREIGLRLAIGARSFDVLLQFLIEAIVISIVGGGLGIGIGFLVSEFLRIYQGMAATIPLNAVLVAVMFSAAVGIFFGFYPARKAANLDPIVALKYE